MPKPRSARKKVNGSIKTIEIRSSHVATSSVDASGPKACRERPRARGRRTKRRTLSETHTLVDAQQGAGR